ncbi:MAG: 16S rRNA (uracil(1498)-N(3))-methyltransferase [Puniceicoccaceae bacterium]
MLRAYCSNWDGGDGLPPLDKEEVHHLVRVRRVRIGEAVEILNGRGAIARCEVDQLSKNVVSFKIMEMRHVLEPRLRRHLLVALPKGKAFATLLHKAVELGVDEITPLLSDNAEVEAGKASDKLERWRSILVEALKQSGNPRLPVLNPPTGIQDALGSSLGSTQRICAALQPDARPLWDLLEDPLLPNGAVDVYVGPEGDFSDREYGMLRESGCHFVTLGPLVLKVETAASLIMGTLGLWAG